MPPRYNVKEIVFDGSTVEIKQLQETLFNFWNRNLKKRCAVSLHNCASGFVDFQDSNYFVYAEQSSDRSPSPHALVFFIYDEQGKIKAVAGKYGSTTEFMFIEIEDPYSLTDISFCNNGKSMSYVQLGVRTGYNFQTMEVVVTIGGEEFVSGMNIDVSGSDI